MDMKKLISVVTESAVNEQPMDMPMAAPPMSPPTPPVTMNMSLNAQGVEQIKELLKMMADASAEKKEEMPMPTVGIDAPLSVAPKEKEKDGGLDDLKALMKMAGAPEKEEYANEPDEKYSDLKAVIPGGNDLHKEKRMFKKANGGDNAMAVESVRQMLDRRYREIKEGTE